MDKKISELNTASAVYDADDFALVQDGETKQVNASTVKAYAKTGLVKGDVGLGNVDNTSDATKNSAVATLTNKTISGSSNTLSNIANASLTNSSITINGNAVSLGGSTTVSASTTNTLTIGTGLSGTSFNGSAATTIAIDSSVVTLTGTQTLTNKTLTSPSISGGTVNNTAIGGTTPAAGNFTTLGATGNVTLGDASGDTLTINGTAVSIPNNLNFDSNTLFIDAANNRVGVGTSSPGAKLDVNSKDATTYIRNGDYTAFASSGSVPVIETLGNRSDGNSSFQGRFGAAVRRSDGTAIVSGQQLGAYAFGGQYGTDVGYTAANLLYAASIMGVAEGSFTAATAMPTGLSFRTGSTGQALSSVNTQYGTERLRINSSGTLLLRQTSNAANTSVSLDTTIQNALTLDSSGRLIIGDTSSSYKLKVVDTASVKMELAGGSAQNGIIFAQVGTAPTMYIGAGNSLAQGGDKGFVIFDGTANSYRFFISETGATRLKTLEGTGSRAVNADASGYLSAASDSRLKQEAKNFDLPGLAEVLQLQPKAYKWLKDIEQRKENAVTEVGFFADEVAPIIPSAAPLCEDGMYGLYDRSITAALVKAIQELHAEIEQLKSRIN